MKCNWRVSLGLLAVTAMVSLLGCTAAPAAPAVSTSAVVPVASTSSSGSSTDFVDAFRKVRPSIVTVTVQYGPQGAPSDPTATGGAGTGFVVGANGVIATNNHVVDGAQSVMVTLADGRQYPVTATQTDAAHDLAVIRIAAQGLPVAAIGDSSAVSAAQPVAAIGNALDLGVRITVGVISRLNVSVPFPNGVVMNGLIETDAPINPGNSGGVLIDLSGNVLGVTNSGLADPQSDPENFGYAIPSNEAITIINGLMAKLP